MNLTQTKKMKISLDKQDKMVYVGFNTNKKKGGLTMSKRFKRFIYLRTRNLALPNWAIHAYTDFLRLRLSTGRSLSW